MYFVHFHIEVLVNTIMIMFSAYIPAHGIRNIKKRYVQHYQRRNVLKTVTEVKLKWFVRYDKFFFYLFFFLCVCVLFHYVQFGSVVRQSTVSNIAIPLVIFSSVRHVSINSSNDITPSLFKSIFENTRST